MQEDKRKKKLKTKKSENLNDLYSAKRNIYFSLKRNKTMQYYIRKKKMLQLQFLLQLYLLFFFVIKFIVFTTFEL